MRIATWNVNSLRVELGLSDVFRRFEQPPQTFSWWDYRMFALPRNHGLRIDLVLASEALAARCSGCHIDREPRRASSRNSSWPVKTWPAEGWRPRKCAPRRGSGAAGLPRLAAKSPRVPFRGGARAPRPSLLTPK
jgi:hypothetical protein